MSTTSRKVFSEEPALRHQKLCRFSFPVVSYWEMISDQELLDQFSRQGSEEAFRSIVEKHVNAVFSTALRRLGGDRSLAEDAAQEVFAALARQASTLRNGDALAAWLHRHTCFVTANLVRSERRRKTREHIAAQQMSDSNYNEEWNNIAPAIDAMIDNLPAPDREAILLRFFSALDFQSIARFLGVSEDAAHKRVTRAVGKLELLFKKNGLVISGGALISLLATKSVVAAPIGLATAISATALVGAASAISGVAASTIVLGKAKAALLIGLVGAAAITPLALQRRAYVALHREHETLRVQLQAQESASNLDTAAARATATQAGPNTSAEVFQLRGQIASLRAELAAKTNAPRQLRVLSEGDFVDAKRSLGPEEVRQILTFDSLQDRGSQTPEAAVQTYFWTQLLTMNPDTFQNANERVMQLVYVPPGTKYGGFGPDVKQDPLRDSKILKIEAVTFPTPDTAKVLVNFYNDLQGLQYGSTYSLIRLGEEWKIDIGLGQNH